VHIIGVMKGLNSIALMVLMTALPLFAATLSPPPLDFPPHPRLEYTAGEIANWKADSSRQGEIQKIVDQAKAILAKGLKVPEKEGNWIFYYVCPKDGDGLTPETPERHVCKTCRQVYTDERTVAAYYTLLHYQLNRDCHALALAYALTGDVQYVTPVTEALLKLARLYPTWTRHDRWGHRGLLAVVGGRRFAQLLNEAISAIELAKVYDLIAPAISEADRKIIEAGCLEDPVREIMRYQIFAGSRNNHQTWFNAAYVATGLAIGDASMIREGIDGGAGLVWQLKESVTSDGLWYEGTLAYQHYAMEAIMETLDAAKRVGWDFSQNVRLKSLWFGPLNLAYPNGQLPVFHDSDPANLEKWKDLFRWGSDYFKDPVLGLYAGKSVAAGVSKPVLKSNDLSGIGIAVLRGGTVENPICAMMDYGLHGDHHGHPDKLNIVLYALGRELVLDPGRLSYSLPEYETWARTTVAHNTIVIDERNQEPDNGKMLYFADKPDFSAAFALSAGAVPGVVLKRFMVLSGELLIDVLAVESRRSRQIDWVLHGRGSIITSLPLAERKTPLGDKSGYQHLRALREGKGVEEIVTFNSKEGKPHRVYCLDNQPTTLVTGEGIGYSRQERTPFLMRRQSGRNAVFLTVHDLSGLDRDLKIMPQFRGGAGRSPAEEIRVKVTFGPTEGRTFVLDLREESSSAERCQMTTP